MGEFIDSVRRRSDGGTDPYIVNALAHLNFVAIHPFSDEMVVWVDCCVRCS
jgi:Fic family protein